MSLSVTYEEDTRLAAAVNRLRQHIIARIENRIKKMSSGERREKAAEIIRNHYPLVLMYHSVVPHYAGENYTISTSTLEKNISDLLKDRYSFVFEDSYFQCPQQSVILTFDDGFANNYSEVFPLLKKYNVKASINLIANRISDPKGEYLSEAQIHEMEQSGLVQFQSHTCSHRSLNQLDLEEAAFEIAESKKKLESLVHSPINVFAYPREDFTQEIAEIASTHYDLCYGWAGNMQINKRFTIPRIEVLEENSDYAYHILHEWNLFLYHKVIWALRKTRPQNEYRKLLFAEDKMVF